MEAGNSPPDTGGVAAPSEKDAKPPKRRRRGGRDGLECFGMRSLEEVPFSTTPSAPLKEASRLLLDVASTPPVSGGELPASDSFRQHARKRRGMSSLQELPSIFEIACLRHSPEIRCLFCDSSMA